jgi:hypothetical protein
MYMFGAFLAFAVHFGGWTAYIATGMLTTVSNGFTHTVTKWRLTTRFFTDIGTGFLECRGLTATWYLHRFPARRTLA